VQFFSDVSQRVGRFASENSTLLLTAGGVVGTVATAVLSGRAGYKYAQILREKQDTQLVEENDMVLLGDVLYNDEVVLPSIDTLEKLKLGGVYFLPPLVVGGATIASIIMAHRISSAKIAALAAAYGLADRNLAEYKAKVAEKLTGPKNAAIGEEISQDRVNRSDGYQSIVIVEGEVLCFDEPTARYFRSTMEKVRKAVNTTNAEILNSGWANATFFYHELGLPATSWTDDMGWNTDQLIDMKYDTVRSPDDRPCISIDFNVLPKPDYVPKHY
jgi:Family of unknown function (DUF6353)